MPTARRTSRNFYGPHRGDWQNAIYNNDLALLTRWLTPSGALARNLNVFDTGESLLHWAARMDRPDVLRLMLRHGSPNQATRDEGLTPLMAAATAGAISAVQVLLPVSDPRRRDHQGRNALHLAAGAEGERQAGVITVLLERLPARSRTQIDQRWALHEACLTGQAGTASGVLAKLDVLLPFGGVHRPDANGQTPLTLALTNEQPWRVEVVARLVATGELPARAPKGPSALDIARQQNDPQLVQILEAAELRQAMVGMSTEAPVQRPRL